MTPTEMGRRSDALYMDTNNAHRRQLCDMIVHREADIEELKEEAYGLHCDIGRLEVENAKLRELVCGLHMAYVGALNECESMDAGLIWDHCEMVDAELAKSHARYEADRHRFDVAMCELGVEVSE